MGRNILRVSAYLEHRRRAHVGWECLLVARRGTVVGFDGSLVIDAVGTLELCDGRERIKKKKKRITMQVSTRIPILSQTVKM